MTSPLAPTIGRIVHYVTKDGAHRPGIIVSVGEQQIVSLHIFADPSDDIIAFQRTVAHSESFRRGTWHWPERND